jgi:hypothetical protein
VGKSTVLAFFCKFVKLQNTYHTFNTGFSPFRRLSKGIEKGGGPAKQTSEFRWAMKMRHSGSEKGGQWQKCQRKQRPADILATDPNRGGNRFHPKKYTN